MGIVFLTALGVGGATILGAGLGVCLREVSHRFSDAVLSFAAGVMLASAVLGLIVPSVEYGGRFGIISTVLGVFAGSLAISLLDRLVPCLHRMAGTDAQVRDKDSKASKILLFVTAIAIHNLPEGIAAGVGFGSGSTAQALLIAGSIALQNIPEGMVLIDPMLSAGVCLKRTFRIAAATGVIEIIGTLLGYLTIRISASILPFALAFAGGTMLHITCEEMIPETQQGQQRSVTYALLAGFCIILVTEVLL